MFRLKKYTAKNKVHRILYAQTPTYTKSPPRSSPRPFILPKQNMLFKHLQHGFFKSREVPGECLSCAYTINSTFLRGFVEHLCHENPYQSNTGMVVRLRPRGPQVDIRWSPSLGREQLRDSSSARRIAQGSEEDVEMAKESETVALCQSQEHGPNTWCCMHTKMQLSKGNGDWVWRL